MLKLFCSFHSFCSSPSCPCTFFSSSFSTLPQAEQKFTALQHLFGDFFGARLAGTCSNSLEAGVSGVRCRGTTAWRTKIWRVVSDLSLENIYDVFPKIVVPQNGWFMMENLIKMDDLGVPLFLETPIWCGFTMWLFWQVTKCYYQDRCRVIQNQTNTGEISTMQALTAGLLYQTMRVSVLLSQKCKFHKLPILSQHSNLLNFSEKCRRVQMCSYLEMWRPQSFSHWFPWLLPLSFPARNAELARLRPPAVVVTPSRPRHLRGFFLPGL